MQHIHIRREEAKLLAQRRHALVVAGDMHQRHRRGGLLMRERGNPGDEQRIEPFRRTGRDQRLFLRDEGSNRRAHAGTGPFAFLLCLGLVEH